MKMGLVSHVVMKYSRWFYLPFFTEKSGLLKYGAVEFGSIFCCVYRPVREKGVGELLL